VVDALTAQDPTMLIPTVQPSMEPMMSSAKTRNVSVRTYLSTRTLVTVADLVVNACQRGLQLSLDKTKCVDARKRSTVRSLHKWSNSSFVDIEGTVQ